MKKIFTMLLVAVGLLSAGAASAQSRDGRYDGPYEVNQQNGGWNNDQNYPGDYDRNHGGYERRNGDYGRQSEYDRRRQAEYERRRQAEFDQMNRDYDRRIDGYRKDRRMARYERERMIQQAEYERQQKAKAFGKGMVVGGIAAIVLGVLIGGGR